MSPVVDGKVVLDKDSFFRNERGLLSMTHLTAFVSALAGVLIIAFSLFGFITSIQGWDSLLPVGGLLVGGGAGLEGFQSKIESNNLGN